MQGLHLTADLYRCQSDATLLTDEAALAGLCRRATTDAGLTIVGEKWHTFPDYQGQPGGVTGMLLLAESHLAVHTWPERGGVTLDVYVCNFEADNSARAEQLIAQIEAAFLPTQSQRQRLMRGERDHPALDRELLMEPLDEGTEYGFRFDRRLLAIDTGLQRLELLESRELGLTLRLDGRLMTSEADEAFYHEALIHPAALAHPAPGRALIVGGGDGGALEELLKHRCVESVTLVELDGGVVDVARTHLKSIHRGSLDDPRVTLRIQDGVAFVRECGKTFDLVYLDLTDPETPAGPLYTQAFFEACRDILAPGGALVLHLGAPFHEPGQVSGLAAALGKVFSRVHGYGLHIPLYGSYWALAVASDSLDPAALTPGDVEARLCNRGIGDLQVYSAEFHGALFALPARYRRLMPAPVSVPA
ncbi:polyamine aminopropyltransferase [Castellaniella denitrificans]|uniref:polyamine aminopropyltransferase n=1 Tax=Castellaniella denitrificans TaxID=56119 RepID=UPI00361573CC